MLRFFRSLFSKPIPLTKLNVILVQDEDGLWFARGVELNYFSSGETEAEVKANFHIGLEETLRLHIEDFGNISALIEPEPRAVLERFGFDASNYQPLSVMCYTTE